jgi:hypothetical protein
MDEQHDMAIMSVDKGTLVLYCSCTWTMQHPGLEWPVTDLVGKANSHLTAASS